MVCMIDRSVAHGSGAVSEEAERVSQRVPLPQSLWLRIVAFLVPGNYGRVELDVSNGRVVSCRIIETIKVRDDDVVQLKESA